MSVIQDFKEFIGSGNAIDMAVGVIIGGAMTTILTSLVQEMIVPLTGLLGKSDFSNTYWVIKGAVPDGLPLGEARKVAGAVVLGYGQFFTVLVNTLMLAFAVFMVVRMLNKLKRRQAVEEAQAPPPEPPAQEVLLSEIRDILKSRPL